MKLICQGIELSDAVLKVVKACATRTTVPVLECIALSARNDSLTLTATDGEISIRKKIKAEIYEEGDVCVPGRYFADYIKKLEGVELTLSTKESKMEITYADSRTSMQVLPADDFPKVDTDIKESSFIMQTTELKKVIAAVSFCSATDDSRPILKGCQFVINGNQLSVTALDGFRLATISSTVVSATGNMEIICPARTLNEIDKMLPIAEGQTEIFVQKGMILVAVDDTVITSRLYGGDFIKKENIIPRSFTSTVTVDKTALKSSIERASILVRNDRNSLIVMDISQGKIEISANSEIGDVKEPVKAELTGKDICIAMNSKYISDALNALSEETVTLSFNSQVQPFICENQTEKDSLYLILPVRMANNT
jgi:DNA polymerase-3 subunit beta